MVGVADAALLMTIGVVPPISGMPLAIPRDLFPRDFVLWCLAFSSFLRRAVANGFWFPNDVVVPNMLVPC